MPSITIQSANVSSGYLNVVYSMNGDSGGHGVRWPTDRLDEFEIDRQDLTDFLLRAVLTWARRRNVTPAQMVGKVITVDPTVLRNLLTVV